MKLLWKLMMAAIPVAMLSACGGGDDAQDRTDVADPVVRFVHASPLAPNVTLYRNDSALPDATNVAYTFASSYADIDMGSATWTVKTADASATSIGSVNIDPVRGDKYTIVALPAPNNGNTVALIMDPYNKPLGSTSTRVRLMNAAVASGSVDIYMVGVGSDINSASAVPTVAATQYGNAGPASGSDSVDIPGGTYDVYVTSAGTKTVLFKGRIQFGDNNDLLFLTVPDASSSTGLNLRVKIEGTPGTQQVTAI
jgi:hypothetical protein